MLSAWLTKLRCEFHSMGEGVEVQELKHLAGVTSCCWVPGAETKLRTFNAGTQGSLHISPPAPSRHRVGDMGQTTDSLGRQGLGLKSREDQGQCQKPEFIFLFFSPSQISRINSLLSWGHTIPCLFSSIDEEPLIPNYYLFLSLSIFKSRSIGSRLFK